MATRRTASSSGPKRATGAARRTTRRAARSTTRRSSSGRLYPRRRRSRPGLPTTVGTALGTLVVTTLLDLSWTVHIGLIVLVVVVGLGYVLWRHRAEIPAGAPAQGEPTSPTSTPAATGPGAGSETSPGSPPPTA